MLKIPDGRGRALYHGISVKHDHNIGDVDHPHMRSNRQQQGRQRKFIEKEAQYGSRYKQDRHQTDAYK